MFIIERMAIASADDGRGRLTMASVFRDGPPAGWLMIPLAHDRPERARVVYGERSSLHVLRTSSLFSPCPLTRERPTTLASPGDVQPVGVLG